MGKASSAKKAARVAKSSSGRKVRSQQGLVFPVALAVVLTLGLALVVYGRATNREDLGAPQLNTVSQPGDHWHSAYGIYICDQYIPNMSVGVEPDPGGIHTHQDGVIHIHPFQTATTGRNARLGDFFAQTGLEVTSSKIQLPDDPALGDNSGKTFENGDECPDGQEGVVKVLVWDNAAGTDDAKVFVADIDRIRFTNNAMAFAFCVHPRGSRRRHHHAAADGGAASRSWARWTPARPPSPTPAPRRSLVGPRRPWPGRPPRPRRPACRRPPPRWPAASRRAERACGPSSSSGVSAPACAPSPRTSPSRCCRSASARSSNTSCARWPPAG